MQHQVEGGERAGLLRLTGTDATVLEDQPLRSLVIGVRFREPGKEKHAAGVTTPDGAFLSAATRREGRYRREQLKPFRLLHTEAAIACPRQVGQTTWTRQLITSSISGQLWAYRRRALRPAVRLPSPSLEAGSGPGQCRGQGQGIGRRGRDQGSARPPPAPTPMTVDLLDVVGLRLFGTTTGTATR